MRRADVGQRRGAGELSSELQNDRRVPKRRDGVARGRSDASDSVDREVDSAKNPAYLFLQAIQLHLPPAVASREVLFILEKLRRPIWDRERARTMTLVTLA